MKMTVEIAERFFEYIEARLLQERAKNSSDNGLTESMACSELRDEILDLIVETK